MHIHQRHDPRVECERDHCHQRHRHGDHQHTAHGAPQRVTPVPRLRGPARQRVDQIEPRDHEEHMVAPCAHQRDDAQHGQHRGVRPQQVADPTAAGRRIAQRLGRPRHHRMEQGDADNGRQTQRLDTRIAHGARGVRGMQVAVAGHAVGPDIRHATAVGSATICVRHRQPLALRTAGPTPMPHSIPRQAPATVTRRIGQIATLRYNLFLVRGSRMLPARPRHFSSVGRAAHS